MDGTCGWAGPGKIYVDYHDTEWGVPEYDPRRLWEKLVLEGFQAGLSWITILRKRDKFRRAFDGFDPHVIAGWGEEDVTRLLADPGIIRHRGKIEATITNARAYLEVNTQEGFDTFLWNYFDGVPLQNHWTTQSEVPPLTPLSTRISKDMKKRGFRFCGPTTVYAFLEANGLVNDHLTTCHRHAECAAMARGAKGVDSANGARISAHSLVLVVPARGFLSSRPNPGRGQRPLET